MQGLSRSQILLAALLIIPAAVAAILHWGAASLSCGFDTSYCAQSTEKNGVYEGTLRSLEEGPYRSLEFEVEFESRRDLPRVSFRTDEAGRYCIQWALERVYPSATIPSADGQGSQGESPISLRQWRDLEGRDPPPGCEEGDGGIPWNRSEGATSTWQFWLLMTLLLTTLSFLTFALFGRRSRYARACLTGGVLLLGIGLVVGAFLWGFV